MDNSKKKKITNLSQINTMEEKTFAIVPEKCIVFQT